MSDSFTGSLPIVQMSSANTFQNKELNWCPTIGHDSCIGTPRKPGSTILERFGFGIMVSIWWIVWAFLVGGYAGMLLVALVVLARKVRAPG
jgi:hypothetical protein